MNRARLGLSLTKLSSKTSQPVPRLHAVKQAKQWEKPPWGMARSALSSGSSHMSPMHLHLKRDPVQVTSSCCSVFNAPSELTICMHDIRKAEEKAEPCSPP